MKLTIVTSLAAALASVSIGAFAADGKAKPDKPAADKANPPATRNWADVDTNKDGLVSPEEMEAYLKANPGPLKPK